MIFLAGEHYLNTSFKVASIRYLSLVSNGSITDPSRIICQERVGWEVVNISFVYICDISVISCGNKHFASTNSTIGDVCLPAFSIVDIEAFNMVNASIQDSYGHGLYASNSNIILQNSSFVMNGISGSCSIDGGAIHATSSSISMEDVSFINNSATSGGAIFAFTSSSINMKGVVDFINNNAKYLGGAIFVISSNISIKGDVDFLINSAESGGAICALLSDISMEGDMDFVNNSAVFGGAIYVVVSDISIEGDASFISNSAENQGGAMYTSYIVSIMMDGNVTFLGNFARLGGAMTLVEDTSCIHLESASLMFHNNQAVNGGAVYIGSSTIHLTGYSDFTGNHADSQGGAIFSQLSDILIPGEVKFLENSAQLGGAVYLERGSRVYIGYNCLTVDFINNITIRGDVDFLNNSAIFGGAICAVSSDISIKGDVDFLNNSAESGGAICVSSSDIRMEGDVDFVNNSAILGGAIYVDSTIISIEGDASFISNSAENQGGAMYTSFKVSITMDGNVTFLGNFARLGGAMSLVDTSCVHLESASLMFHNNQAVRGGALYISYSSSFYLRGYSNFTGNHADSQGGAIFSRTSDIYIPGEVKFLENSAQLGGAVFLEYGSRVNFGDDNIINCDYSVTFQRNKAKRGGAVYARDAAYYVSCFHDLFINFRSNDCPFTIPFSINCVSFNSNEASERGADVFGGFTRLCVESVYISAPTPSAPMSISSEPSTIKFCNHSNLHSPLFSNELTVSRGATFRIPVIAHDQVGSPVPATLRAYFTFSSGSNSDLAEGQSLQKIGVECTLLNYTVFSRIKTVDLYIYAEEGPCGPDPDPEVSMRIRIHLQECPHVFVLNNSHCVCEKRLQEFTNSCNIDNRTFKRTRGSNFWVGIEQQNGTYLGLILHPHCPLDYCRNDQIDVSTEDLDSQCQFNRTGILCGTCRSNFSLALGGSQCLECTNSHLGLLIVFAVAGIILVFIITLLRLTVSIGTLSGLIFYANIIAVNRAIFLPRGTTNILTVFVAWLNLDVGIVTCFFDGMDTYTLTWLQYVFPCYIWFLAIVIVLISQRSVRISRFLGNNPVSVLTTLFLLSYASILRTIITALSPTTLDYPDNRTRVVWRYDGHVDYLKGKHIPLFVFSLIVLLLFLPYTLFLFFSQWLQVLSNRKILFWMNSARIKIFLDTYHAPHNIKHRYWPGLLLLVRCALFIVFASNPSGDPSINLLCITLASLGLAVFTRSINIYSKGPLDILEGSFILNLGILAGASYYVRLSGGNQEVVTYLSIGIVLTEFVGIVIYHVIIQLKDTAVVKCITMPTIIKVLQRDESGKEKAKKDDIKNDTEMGDIDGAIEFEKCANYRESVLYIADD